jgi:hypothetical protein
MFCEPERHMPEAERWTPWMEKRSTEMFAQIPSNKRTLPSVSHHSWHFLNLQILNVWVSHIWSIYGKDTLKLSFFIPGTVGKLFMCL